MVTQSLARLKRTVKRLGITQTAIAQAAGGVDPSLVSRVLSGQATSANVLRTAKRLVAEARERVTAITNGGTGS